jgi:hypothetical protein
MNKIKPVYHGEHGLRMLKEWSSARLAAGVAAIRHTSAAIAARVA